MTLRTLGSLERSHGQFYNWYDPDTGARLTTWPVDGSPVPPFLSTVDNGWLASALLMVERAVPQLRDEAAAIVDGMDFGLYYDGLAGGRPQNYMDSGLVYLVNNNLQFDIRLGVGLNQASDDFFAGTGMVVTGSVVTAGAALLLLQARDST